MELTRTGCAVIYVILLCALAQGGSEGKEDELLHTDHGPFSSSLYYHEKQAKNVWKYCRKELTEKNNDHGTPPASISEEKTSSRYLLTKHSRSTLALKDNIYYKHRHHGTNSIAETPHDHISHISHLSPMSPSPASNSPSPDHESVSPSQVPTPVSSSSPSTSPTPVPSTGIDYLPLPPNTPVPLPPSPHQSVSSSLIFRPISSAPVPSSPSYNNENRRKQTIILAASVSGIIVLIGLSLCYREAKTSKVDKDERHFLVLTSSDYSTGSQKVVRLGSVKEESGINNGNNPSNVRNWSMKGRDNNNSAVIEIATTSEDIGQQVTRTSSAKPALLPPGPPPPPPPQPPALGPSPPPPPKAGHPPPPNAGHPPPAPPKPMAGRNQATPLGPLKQGSSNEGDAPKPKLKPFFWDKVNAKPDQSMVWHEISSGSFVINEEMMESLFGCTNQNKNERRKDSPSVDTSVHYIQIIDPRKAQNLSILLRALNVTTEEVIDALKEGTEIPVELIQTLLKMAPTQEEELKLRLFSGELSQLGPAERFLKLLVDIPFAFKRLESLMFMFILQEEASSIKDSFATLEVACNKLRKSRLFLKLLEAVLKTGNRMNDGTYRGGAQAFRLDTLLKLSDVKGTDGKTTLLHFVVQEIIRSEGIRAVRTKRESRSNSSVGTEESDPESEESEEHYRSLGLQVVSSLSNELEDVKKAALIDGDALSNAVLKLSHWMVKTEEFLNTDLKNLEEEKEEKSEFQSCLEKFMEFAKGEVTCLVEEEKRIMALVKSTADYFHGNAGKDEGLRLFLIVHDFLIVLDKVCKEVREATLKATKASGRKEATSSVSSSPDTQYHQPQSPSQQSQQPSDLHRRLFPAIAGRRIDYSSSDDDDDEEF